MTVVRPLQPLNVYVPIEVREVGKVMLVSSVQVLNVPSPMLCREFGRYMLLSLVHDKNVHRPMDVRPGVGAEENTNDVIFTQLLKAYSPIEVSVLGRYRVTIFVLPINALS